MDELSAKKAREFLRRSQHILLATHERPDGDGLGSLLGLAWMLRGKGKTLHLLSKDGVPATFHFLPGYKEVSSQIPAEVDLIVYLDCSDADRVGEFSAPLPSAPTVNIDHHTTNSLFAEANLIEQEAVAMAEVVYDLVKPLRLSLNLNASTGLLTGLVTDTLGFRTANVNPKSMLIAQKLMRAGANLSEIVEWSMNRRSFSAARYWGPGLSRIEREDRMVWTWLSLADRRLAGYPGRDDADLINILSSVEGADLAMIFVEQEGGTVKVSWRAHNGLDITPIAKRYGGGGHPAAAGATVPGSLEQVAHTVVEATHKWLSDKL